MALLTGAVLAACGSLAPASPRIHVEGAWARPTAAVAPMPMTEGSGHMGSSRGATENAARDSMMSGAQTRGATSAVYFILVNEGSAADRLAAVRTEVAAKAELHQATIESGIARMQPVAAVEVPAGGRAELRPGGLHIMLTDLRQNLQVGDRFSVVLQFERSGDLAVAVEVRGP